MELSDQNFAALHKHLSDTLSPDASVRKPAETFLEQVEVNENYPMLLLKLLTRDNVEMTIRVACAITFKNYIKRNWHTDEDSVNRISANDRLAIKENIVNIMVMSPEGIQKQLSDAVAIIGRYDFPSKWQNLISQMVDNFRSGDLYIINGVLHTAHSIFKRYRYEFKSQVLWTEIKLVLDNFAKPLTELFVSTMNLATVHTNNPDALKVIYSSLIIISKVFYSLNFQDIPEFFEDNMEIWMSNFHTLLTADIPCLHTQDEDEPGLLEQLKSQICDNAALYAQKYDEEFKQYLPTFVTAVWNLLTSTSHLAKYDALVSNALQFLATVADRSHYRHLFEDPAVLSNICEKVIIPNMEFRTSDEELFEDNPEEYIRRDIEGSDVDTRRRAACDLVKVLSRYFEEKMMQIFGQYVQAMLQKYNENPTQNWRSKDAALYLVTSLAAKGQTEKHGVTQSSQLVNLTDFAAQHIIPELEKPDVNSLPVIRADAIKYIMIFRTVLPREGIAACIPKLITHLSASSPVVHTYAAASIEKILAIRGLDHQPMIKKEEVSQLASFLLNSLFAALSLPGSAENEYVMKAIMRSFSSLQEHVIPFLADLLPKLTEKLELVAKNPSKPHFNHYLFETISLSIRIVCKSNPAAVSSFEEALFQIFERILTQDVQEFIPYVFQLLSLLLELHESGTIPETYMLLFPCLLKPVLWDRPGNIHPLVRLLRAFIHKGPAQIAESGDFSGLLGVFQKLVASKANDHEGFYLIQSLIEHTPTQARVSEYLQRVFMLLFQRLQSSKTTKFVKGLLVFMCFYAVKYGAKNLVEIIDGIQTQMFGMVLERLMIVDMQKISGNVERKIAAVGVTKILCECPQLIDGPYARLWSPLLQALIGLFELPKDESTHPDDHFIEVDDTPGYSVAYSQLTFANKQEHDPLAGVGDARLNLAQSLSKLSIAYPGILTPLLTTGLTDSDRAHLKSYLDAAKVQIA